MPTCSTWSACLVPGRRLDEVAATASLAQVLTWIRQVAEALDYLHAEVHEEGPVVHRDVKPSNVIVTPGDNAVLIDPGWPGCGGGSRAARHGDRRATYRRRRVRPGQ